MDIKAVEALGDQVGVTLAQLYGPKSLAQPKNLRTALWLIKVAFEQRSELPKELQQPLTTLALLRALQNEVTDGRYQARIAELIERLGSPADVTIPPCDDPLASPLVLVNSRTSVDLTFQEPNKKQVNLSDYKGRIVILILWNSLSDSRQIRILVALQDMYKELGVSVIGVWVDVGGPDALRRYLAHDPASHVNFPIFIGDLAISRIFGTGYPPFSVLLDRRGRIALFQSSDGSGQGPYFCTYDDAIRDLLGERNEVDK